MSPHRDSFCCVGRGPLVWRAFLYLGCTGYLEMQWNRSQPIHLVTNLIKFLLRRVIML